MCGHVDRIGSLSNSRQDVRVMTTGSAHDTITAPITLNTAPARIGLSVTWCGIWHTPQDPETTAVSTDISEVVMIRAGLAARS